MSGGERFRNMQPTVADSKTGNGLQGGHCLFVYLCIDAFTVFTSNDDMQVDVYEQKYE
jgi:hypothetical protein